MASGKTPTWRRVGWLAHVGVLLASICSLVSSQIKGDFNKCDVEGAVIDFPVTRGNPCITCYCQNGIVRCKKKSCAKLDDCALVLKSLEDDCCEQCKTCFLNGDFFESGQAWTTLDADTGQCQHFQCQEGVITASLVQCEPQCEHPYHRDDSCCPVCPGCILNGVFLAEGETSYKQDDPCVECKCEEASLSCFRRSCPVLSCPGYQMETPPGECCPKCTAQRRVFDLGNRCIFDGGVYEDAEIVFQDDCTLCTCLSATVMCRTTQCPTQYDCPKRLLIRDEGSCCPRCADCEVDGVVYKHNDVWQVSACQTCRCSGGRVHCETNTCETAPQSCPGNMKQVLKTPEGECCPRCVERDGTCTVFGDPHYRTFDGRLFNFQGRCKYLLTADCTHNSFRIRVRNDGRGSLSASWSKTVFIHVGEHTITLLQGKKIRVNRTEIKVPFTETSLGHIDIENYIVKVNLNIGIKVLWDGDSFIEVTASTEFRDQLCGLCGDYDGDRHNDFRTFKGAIVKDVNVFASSWRIGSKEDCDISEKNKLPPCRKNSTLKVQAKRDCRIIKSSAFDPCKGEVDQWVYYRSCMTDVCECGPSHSCACEAVLAFIRECQRHGITLPDVYSGNCIL